MPARPGPHSSDPVRVRIGLLGYGRIGQALARRCEELRGRLEARGWALRVTGALVRDASRPRSVWPGSLRITAEPEDFFRRRYDAVVEVMGGVEPAREYVVRALARGIPVITANKSLLAACGKELFEQARRSGGELRCEASVIAGVPFLHALRQRPGLSLATGVTGILNGTSNFIVSEMSTSGIGLDEALRRAQQLGYAEPDPRSDLSGRDAAEKLRVLMEHLGWNAPRVVDIPRQGIERLIASDLRQAAALGGVIRPLARAWQSGERVEAWVGPAFLAQRHPLAGIHGVQNALYIEGESVGPLLLAGPGAGPLITASTILDDLIEAIEAQRRPRRTAPSAGPPGAAHRTSAADEDCAGEPRSARAAPDPLAGSPHVGAWFLRIMSASRSLAYVAVAERLSGAGVKVDQLIGAPPVAGADLFYALTAPCSARAIRRTLAGLRAATARDGPGADRPEPGRDDSVLALPALQE